MCAITDDDVKKMDEEANAEVAKAVQFAEESEQPQPSELFTDVVSNG